MPHCLVKTRRPLPTFQRFFHEQDGATIVEYALMIALIAAVVITVVTVLGQKTNNAFNNVNNAM